MWQKEWNAVVGSLFEILNTRNLQLVMAFCWAQTQKNKTILTWRTQTSTFILFNLDLLPISEHSVWFCFRLSFFMLRVVVKGSCDVISSSAKSILVFPYFRLCTTARRYSRYNWKTISRNKISLAFRLRLYWLCRVGVFKKIMFRIFLISSGQAKIGVLVFMARGKGV